MKYSRETLNTRAKFTAVVAILLGRRLGLTNVERNFQKE